MLKLSEIPLLYKYLPIERIGPKKGFFPEMSLSASIPKYLNDPHECMLGFDNTYLPETIREWKNLDNWGIKEVRRGDKDRGNKTRSKRSAQKFLRWRRHKLLTSPKYKEKERELDKKIWEHSINRKFGIISFSKDEKNPVMWTHYASEHRGFVVGFNFANKNRHVTYPTERICEFFEVEYLSKLLQAEFSPTGRLNFNSKVAYTKGKRWEHEKEIRAILPRNQTWGTDKINLWKFAPEVIDQIIFGEKISDENRNRIIKICKRPDLSHVKFYKAEINYSNYEMKIVPITV